MEVFTQQLINGITLGSIYGLIAIGYTMVFGIIGMVNFAHGDVFMVSAFIALITLLVLTTWLGMASVVLALLIVLVVAMLLTSLVNWTIERVAYRPLRGSFRLAPLISAIGMSIFLSNFVQVAQGPRVKSIPPLFNDVIVLMSSSDGYEVSVSYKQLMVWVVTAALLAAFWFVVTKTALGRAQRACEQDQKMAALLGIDVDRTVSITFVIAAALAAVAGTMYLVLLRRGELRRRLRARREGVHRRGPRGHRLAPGRGARRPVDRPHRDDVVGLLLHRLQGRRRLLHSRHHHDLPAPGDSGPAGRGEGVRWRKRRPGPPRASTLFAPCARLRSPP